MGSRKGICAVSGCVEMLEFQEKRRWGLGKWSKARLMKSVGE